MDKSLFKRAIEDTPDATPGYMFRDIAQWTFVDQNTQTKLVTALFDKLTPKNSVHVLAKVLRIIKIVCETGHSDFQKEIQRRSDQIKDYASFRGVPHPQFGDRLNEKVRVAAKDAIEAAFTSRKSENKIQVEAGHGSEPSKASSSASGVVGGVFNSLGFSSFTTGHQISASQAGDTRVAAMPTTNKWAEHMARSGAEPSASLAAVSSVVDKAKLGFGLFGNEQIKSKEDRMWSAQSEVGEFKAVDIAFVGGSRGPFGPNATTFGDSSSSSSAAHGASGGGAGWKFGSEAEAGLPPIEQHSTLGGRFLTPYQREVERIATMKNTPQRVDLTQFLAAVKDIHDNQGMSYEDLAQTLDEYIGQKHAWQARLNVMTLIEALVKTELTSEIGDYFNENPEDVQRNVHVVQSSLKEKSQRVLKLLGIPEKTTVLPQQQATSTSASHHANNSADNNTLGNLDFDGMTVTRKPKRAVGKSGGNEMMGGGNYEDSSQVRGGSSERTSSSMPFVTNNNNSGSATSNLDDILSGAAGKHNNNASPNQSSSDPTKLRKRAQMNIDALEANNSTNNNYANNNSNNSTTAVSSGWGAPVATTTTSTDAGGWGNAAAGSGGWGTVGASSSSGGDGWGTPSPPAASPIINNNNNGSPTMRGGGWGASGVSQQMPPSQQQQQQQQPTRAKPAVDFDELFSSAPSFSPSTSQQQQQTAAGTLPAPTVTASAAAAVLTPAQQAANQQMTMVLQMQQQVQAMLTKINMNDPSALPQMQMLMQQQQQLMTMMQQAQQAQAAADAAAAASAPTAAALQSSSANSSLSCNSPVQPHGHFDAPPLVKDHTKEKAFADVQNEMVQMLMSQK